MPEKALDAVVFDIREMTLHDGPGVRVTVFLKGCPLDCPWCHNPEGKGSEPQIMIKRTLCRGCGLCTKDKDSEEYRKYGRNISSCPDGLISLCGKIMSPKELKERIAPLADLLSSMDGGVTFSGGEPLLYPGFIIRSASLLHSMGLTVAIETSGYAEREVFRSVVEVCDYVMMDIKLFDRVLHEKYTGKDNRMILENARYLMECGKAFEFRTPLIGGITDTEENLAAIGDFVKDSKWVKLPENEFARAKDNMMI